jgi:hypothetical protein
MNSRRGIRRGSLAIAVIAIAGGATFASTTTRAGAIFTSTTRLAKTPNQTIGHPVTLAATVSGLRPAPTGFVQFYEDVTPLGDPQPLVTGTSIGIATLSQVFDAGTHTVSATYLGDVAHAGSTSLVRTFIVGDPSNTVTVLQPHSVPAAPSTTWTATTHMLFVGNVGIGANQINYGGRTGTATVRLDGVPYVIPIVRNRIIFDLPNGIGLGAHAIVATYTGDIHYNASTSTTRHVTIVNP